MRKTLTTIIIIGIVLLGIILYVYKTPNIYQPTGEEDRTEDYPEIYPTTPSQQTINFQQYDHQFVEGPEIERILDELIGQQGKNEFYLPPTGYINLSRGEDFGVAFAINNPQPSGNNYFTYEFTPDQNTLTSCGVDYQTASSWISMGHESFGKVPQGWIDKMSVYFIFNNVPKPCTATYNFKLTKDGQLYATKQLVFNLA